MMFWLLVIVMLAFALIMLFFPQLRAVAAGKNLATVSEHVLETKSNSTPTKLLMTALMILFPAVVIAMYQYLGSPQLVNIPQSSVQMPANHPVMSSQSGKAPDIATLFEQLKARLAENPNDAQGWMMMGLTYMHYEQFDEAVDAYQKAVDLLGDDQNALAALARAKAAKAGNKRQLATPRIQKKMTAPNGAVVDVGMMVERLRKKLEANPNNLQGWLMLGRSYNNLGHYDDAVYAYQQALKLNPNDPSIQQLIEQASAAAKNK